MSAGVLMPLLRRALMTARPSSFWQPAVDDDYVIFAGDCMREPVFTIALSRQNALTHEMLSPYSQRRHGHLNDQKAHDESKKVLGLADGMGLSESNFQP